MLWMTGFGCATVRHGETVDVITWTWPMAAVAVGLLVLGAALAVWTTWMLLGDDEGDGYGFVAAPPAAGALLAGFVLCTFSFGQRVVVGKGLIGIHHGPFGTSYDEFVLMPGRTVHRDLRILPAGRGSTKRRTYWVFPGGRALKETALLWVGGERVAHSLGRHQVTLTERTPRRR